MPTDVTDPAQVHALVSAAIDRHGRVDALVSNAGASYHVRVEEINPAAYLELLNLNVVSVVNGIQAVLPHMRANGGGQIINVSSGSTAAVTPGVGALLSDQMRREHAQRGGPPGADRRGDHQFHTIRDMAGIDGYARRPPDEVRVGTVLRPVQAFQ